jgi:hypothetical protein
MLPGGNPISRGVDRLEGFSLVVFVVFAVLLVPIMLMAGSLTYGSIITTAEQQARTRHQVVATLLEDTMKTSADGSGPYRVRARWLSAEGPRTGRVLADKGLQTGDRIRIWLDEKGRPVTAPAGAGEAALAAALVVITGWLTAAGVLGLVHGGVKRLLDRRRYREWEREWAQVEPRWRAGPGPYDEAR